MFSFDFSNVSLNRPPSEAGVYTVKITDVDSYKARSGALRIGFKSTITDGDHEVAPSTMASTSLSPCRAKASASGLISLSPLA